MRWVKKLENIEEEIEDYLIGVSKFQVYNVSDAEIWEGINGDNHKIEEVFFYQLTQLWMCKNEEGMYRKFEEVEILNKLKIIDKIHEIRRKPEVGAGVPTE